MRQQSERAGGESRCLPLSAELENQKAIMLVLVTLAQLISREGSF
jgi:hypothetical protein